MSQAGRYGGSGRLVPPSVVSILERVAPHGDIVMGYDVGVHRLRIPYYELPGGGVAVVEFGVRT